MLHSAKSTKNRELVIKYNRKPNKGIDQIKIPF